MSELSAILDRAVDSGELTDAELEYLLGLTAPDELQALYHAAYEVKKMYVGTVVRLRGLIELSNRCVKDCLYCGIRRSNREVERFELSREEILHAAWISAEFGYGSVVLQGGERTDAKFVEFIADLLREIKSFPEKMGITLSLGEQTREVYQMWREAGADRYLLRIESSDPELYAQIHPSFTTYAARRQALDDLQSTGYQTGTGVMIGLPGQTLKHLVKDLRFYQNFDIDMVGMGPWIPHFQTPMGQGVEFSVADAAHNLELSLKMIALTRILMRDVNIASSTALQALDPAHGRERGLLAGANVIMPNAGEVNHRRDYQLYEGKPGLDENSLATRKALEKSIRAVGETIKYHSPGDPLHYYRRREKLLQP